MTLGTTKHTQVIARCEKTGFMLGQNGGPGSLQSLEVQPYGQSRPVSGLSEPHAPSEGCRGGLLTSHSKDLEWCIFSCAVALGSLLTLMSPQTIRCLKISSQLQRKNDTLMMMSKSNSIIFSIREHSFQQMKHKTFLQLRY